MSVSFCLLSRQGRHAFLMASFYKIHSDKVGVLFFFITAKPYYKLFHLSIWQNNQEKVVFSVPAALSTSQSTSHCL